MIMMNSFSTFRDLLMKVELSLRHNLFLPAFGLLPLAYVFYAGFIDLPPLLNTPFVFFLLFAGLALVLHWRQGYFIPLLLVGYLGLFFLPLTWQWRGLEFDTNLLMGVFPFNDGMYYLTDAYRLNAGLGTMILQNGRPIYPGLLAFFMWIFGGNLQAALAVICIVTAFSIFVLALEIREISGPYSAALLTAILFYFAYAYVGRVHTESLGLAFGTLGLTLLLRGARKNNIWALVFGALALSMGLNVRAGAFFTLPFLLCWGWIKRETFGRKLLFLLILSILAGFLVNTFLMDKFAVVGFFEERTPFSNFGFSLYGLAAGYKTWGYIFAVHPELTNYSNAWPYAWDLVRQQPLMLLWGIFLSYKDYFSPNGMFYIMRLGDQQIWVSWILYVLMFIGFYRLLKLRYEEHWFMFLFLLFGVLLSMSMIPYNDNGLRILMTTNPINILVVSLAFAIPSKPLTYEEYENTNPEFIAGLVLILTLMCTVGPSVVTKLHKEIPPLDKLNCPEGTEQISLYVMSGSYINVVKVGPEFGFLPEVKKIDIKARLDDYYIRGEVPYDPLTNFPAFERMLRKLKQGDSIIMGFNLVDLNKSYGPEKFVFVITRTKQIQKIGDVNNFCARLPSDERFRSNLFYFDQSVDILE